jgi:molybdopterin-biosynthesis enzyme MoeA-like protein
MAAIASAFDVSVVREPRMEKLLRKHYGRATTENHLLLANIPDGAEQLYSDRSPWPLTVFKNVWILPGVPEIFQMKLTIVAEHLKGDAPFVSRAVFTKLDEAMLKPLLDSTVSEHPGVDIGSYPRWQDPSYETKVTFDGKDRDAVERAFEDFQKKLPDGEPQWTE